MQEIVQSKEMIAIFVNVQNDSLETFAKKVIP